MGYGIKNDTDLVVDMCSNMVNSAKKFSINSVVSYEISNLEVDRVCYKSYSCGVRVTKSVSKEMNRTAEFMASISMRLAVADNTMAIENSKKI